MTEFDGSGAPTGPAEATRGDRRRYKRVAVNLPGRYMLEDGSEHACVCVDLSVGGARLVGTPTGPWGSRVVAYIDGIGRMEGHIVRRAIGWFVIESRATARKFERVQERIALVMQAAEAEGRDRSRRERAARIAHLFTRDGRTHDVELTDLNRSGAALMTDAPLVEGERVRLDSRRARVTRLFPGGAALSFENWKDESLPPREKVSRRAPPAA